MSIKKWRSQKQYLGYMSDEEKRAIAHNRFHEHTNLPVYNCFMMSMEQAIEKYRGITKNSHKTRVVVDDIRKPAPPHILDRSDGIYKKVLRIMPSLARENELRLDVNGLFPDIGKVATGQPECILRKRPSAQAASHKHGSSGFRVVICTDNAFGGTSMGPALMAMNRAISMILPCEIFVQQGWIAGISEEYRKSSNGLGSVNMISLPTNLDPSLLWFWCGSSYKDGEFSGTIATKYLKSVFSGVSNGPEIQCDIYGQDDHLVKIKMILMNMGMKNVSDEDVAAFWISKIISEKFLAKEMLDNPEILNYIGQVKKEQV